jgi:hypothetical protein
MRRGVLPPLGTFIKSFLVPPQESPSKSSTPSLDPVWPPIVQGGGINPALIRKDMNTLIIPLLATLSFQSALALVAAPGTVRIQIDMDMSERLALMEPVKTEVQKAQIKVFAGTELKQSGFIALRTRGQTSLRQFFRKNMTIECLVSHTWTG